MAWPASPTTTGSGTSSGSSTTVATSAAVAVTAGDLVYAAISWEGADTTLSVADGGVNTYSELYAAHGNNGTGNPEPWQTGFWAVAATTTSVTITATYGAARTFKAITVLVLHPDAAGTISLDGTPVAAGAISTQVLTGNITTSTRDTNCGVAIVGYSEYGTNPTNEQINATAADNVTNNGAHEVWMLRYTNGFTGQGTADLSFNNWAAGISAFKIVATGTPPLGVFEGKIRPAAFSPGIAR